MKLLLVSDLHIDINKCNEFEFMKEKPDLLVIAGDIANDVYKTIEFLNELKQKMSCPIVSIAGSHTGFVYNKPVENTDNIIENAIFLLQNQTKDNLYFLHNEWIDLNNYVIFGGTMYTDFECGLNTELCKNMASTYMNEFFCIYTKDGNGFRHITPEDYIKWHEIFKNKLKQCMEETSKDIIAVTHFGPSTDSMIDERYKKSPFDLMVSTFVADMKDFIKDNKRIKYWLHGKLPKPCDYKIDQCRVVSDLCGIHTERIESPQKYKGRVLKI